MTIAELPLFVLDPHAEPPFAKCRKLESSHTTFRKSLDGTTDESPPERDMSLASIAAGKGWSDQEIVNLLVALRRDKGADPLEKDYYARIIVQARAPIAQARAQERFATNDGEDRAEKLADLSTLLGLSPGAQILDLVKYVGDPPEFWMETSGGSITLGIIDNIVSQTRFINAVAATTKQVLVRCTLAAWRRRAKAILSCCRDVELGDASHPAIETAKWLESYLDSQTILDDKNVACEQRLPFRREDGAILFPLDGFRQYLRFSMGERLSSHKLGQRLRLCGVTPTHVNVDLKKGGRSTRAYWIHNKASFSHSELL